MKFKKYSFLSLLSNIADNRGKTCPTEDRGTPLIATNCIKNDSLYPVFEKVRYVSEETYKNWFRCHPKPNDMIFVCKGSPGRVAWTTEPINFCIAQDMVAIRANEKIVYPKYLFALLRSNETQKQIENMHVGTLIPHFKKGDFGNLYFDIPDDFNHQKIVGDTYFDFCLKIETNRQINQTLEQMAQAIFKSWLVDFDPVRAKMEGRQPEGMDAETAALFPSEFEESELGLIPKGWKVASLPDVIDFLEGPGIRNWQYTEDEDGIKFINIRCIKDGDLKIETASKLTREEALGKYKHFQLQVDDIVISTSGTLGRFAFVREEHLPLSLNTSVIRLKPITGVSTLHYLHGYADTQLQVELEARASGSAQRNFGPMHLKQIRMLLPDFDLLKAHAELIEPLFRKRQCNLKEIDSLSQTRDALLPKLLSGDISTFIADKLAETA